MRGMETNWETCADEAGIDKNKIKSCFEGEEGKQLFSASIQKSNEVGASGSPTIYKNDVSYSGARDTVSFQKAICQHISDHPECQGMPKCSVNTDCTEQEGKIGVCLNPGTKERLYFWELLRLRVGIWKRESIYCPGPFPPMKKITWPIFTGQRFISRRIKLEKQKKI